MASIDKSNIAFFRNDGIPAKGPVYAGGELEDGEQVFFEVVGLAKPVIDGKEKYRRLLIRRVFPYASIDGEDGDTNGLA